MTVPSEPVEACTTRPRLTLIAMLEAAHALHLANALPTPPDVQLSRLVQANGMRPWLRIALGDAAASALEASGRGGWHVCALLGHENGPRREPLVDADPTEVMAIILVDAFCEEYASPCRSLWFCLRNRMPMAAAAAMLPEFVEREWDADWRAQPSSAVFEASLDTIAARFALSPKKRPADLSIWHERVVDGVAKRRTPREYYANSPGAMKEPEGMVVALSDGIEVWVHERDPILWPGRHGPELGTRLRLTWLGATSGHGGYLARVHDLATIEMSERIRAELAWRADLDAILARHAELRAVDGHGRDIAEHQTVELLTDCLEARKGTTGRVVEIAGDMAIVNFGHRGARKVPCYGHALAVLG